LPVFQEAIISHLRQQQTYSILALLEPSSAAAATAASSAILSDVVVRHLQLCHLMASAPIIFVVNSTLTFIYT